MSDDPSAGLAGPAPEAPAPLASYVNAFRAGRSAGAKTPDGVNALTGQDPAAEALRQRIAALSPGERAAAARQAEILGVLGQGLAGRPYAERRALLAHMAPALAARGVDPGAIAGFDPSDDNLAAAMRQAASVRGMLGQAEAASC